MMLHSSVNTFKMFLCFSIFFAYSTNSSLILWVSLEINMMSILPLLALSGFKMYENSMKYFLIQSIASIAFLIALLVGQINQSNFTEIIMLLTMFAKMGSAPLHGWYISLLKTSTINTLILLTTLQKFIPCLILSMVSDHSFLILMILSMNMLFTVTNSLMVMDLNHILAYSSINNVSWMVISVWACLHLFVLFMLFYMVTMIGLLLYNWNPVVNNFIQINMLQTSDKVFLVFIMLSLGGLPPFLGFLAKLIVLKSMIFMLNMVFVMVLMYSSIIVLMMYTYYSFLAMNFAPSSYSMPQYKHVSGLKFMYFLTITSLPLVMMLIL